MSMATLASALVLSATVWACSGNPAPIVQTSAPAAAPPVNGLPPAANAPSFMPTHITGPHVGRAACPLCVYGNKPQLQIWVQEANVAQALELAKLAERDLVSAGQPYLVVVPSKSGEPSDATITTIKQANLKHVFATHVPNWTDAETSGLYNHTDAYKPKVRVYSVVNRRLFARWDEPGTDKWPDILKKVTESRRFQEESGVTDRQIAPKWEPGQRFTVVFEVFDKQGKPMRNAKVTAWQTDETGLYNPREFGHIIPRLQVNAWTDSNGRIEFDTVYPGPYPAEPEPSHIHFAIPVDGKNQWRTLWFEGDPLLTKDKRDWERGNEETVIVPIDKSKSPWRVSHRYIVQ